MTAQATEPGTLPSLGFTSAARLSADIASVIFGIVSATVTARWLGPDGKGTLSSLLFIWVLLSYASSLGLGDAAIILIQQKRASVQDAVRSILPPALVATVVGSGLLAVAAVIADWSAIVGAVVVVALALPVATTVRLLIAIENARERIAFTSLVFAVASATTAVALVIFVALAELGIFGGALASFLGSGVALTMLIGSLHRGGVSLRPVPRRDLIATALRIGVVIEISYILGALSQRVDLLIVYSMAGEASAGRYSVALTLAQLAAYGPFALSVASFPRMAGMQPNEVSEMIERLSRAGLAIALGSAAILFLAIPVLVPALFGSEFAAAVRPALIMLIGSVVWSEQWLFARAAAARGDGPLYFRSLGVSLVVMVALDMMMIPRFGIEGAAIASVVAPTLGLLVVFAPFRRRHAPSLRMAALRPGRADFALLGTFVKDAGRRLRVRG